MSNTTIDGPLYRQQWAGLHLHKGDLLRWRGQINDIARLVSSFYSYLPLWLLPAEATSRYGYFPLWLLPVMATPRPLWVLPIMATSRPLCLLPVMATSRYGYFLLWLLPDHYGYFLLRYFPTVMATSRYGYVPLWILPTEAAWGDNTGIWFWFSYSVVIFCRVLCKYTNLGITFILSFQFSLTRSLHRLSLQYVHLVISNDP